MDDGQEVLLLRPAYAMYRFYAEVAGAAVREIDYDGPAMEFPLAAVLDAITPATRAVLIANPNNPTGTGLSLPAIERILKRARKAAVFIDEAYFEFSGVTALGQIERSPNLFVSRTFSKVYGMAAMRLGCLFSHPANIAYLHKAQSPYSVNTLAVLAAQAAIRDTAYIESYVAEVLAARELLCVGLERLQIGYVPSSANFVLIRAGARAIEIRDHLRGRGILVRDRSYEAPGCVRITVGTREQTRRLLAALEEIWLAQLIVFDMDGVLVDVTESYRETIVRTVEHFTGMHASPAPQIQDYKNQGGFNDDWKLSHHVITQHGVAVEFQTVVDYFQGLFHGNGTDGLILRERWMARDGLFDRLGARFDLAIFTGRMRWEAEVTLNRFAPSLRFDPDRRHGRRRPLSSPRPKACSRSPPWPAGAESGTSATRWMTRAAPGPRPCRSLASRRPRVRAAASWLRCSRPKTPSLCSTTSINSKACWSDANATIQRDTKETQIKASLKIEGRGRYQDFHRHPLLRSHAGAVRQARRLRSEARRQRRPGRGPASHRRRRRHRARPVIREGAGRPARHQSRGLLRAAHG